LNRPIFIETILNNHNLIDFLRDRGHSPVRATDSRYVYSCPLHGPEANPSFYVFTDKEFPYFHCFGCKNHGDVINLMAAMDSCSIKESIGKLAHGLDIPHTDIIDQIALELELAKANEKRIEDIVVNISFAIRASIETVDFDDIEYVFFENVYRKIDERVEAMDIETLVQMEELLLDGLGDSDSGLVHRMKMFNQRKEEEQAKVYVKSY